MERLRRRLELAAAEAEAIQKAPFIAFDRSCPWDAVWKAACSDQAFWHKELEEPALLILAKAGKLGDAVDGDAPVAGRAGSSGDVIPPGRPRERGPKRKPGNDTPREKHHMVRDGLYTHNRNRVALCEDFNSAQGCEQSNGIWCRRHPEHVHQCAKCLSSSHSAVSCNASPKSPGKGKPGKGKGKGKKGTGRWQY